MVVSPKSMALNNFGICEGYCSIDGYCWKDEAPSSTNCEGCVLGKQIFLNLIKII